MFSSSGDLPLTRWYSPRFIVPMIFQVPNTNRWREVQQRNTQVFSSDSTGHSLLCKEQNSEKPGCSRELQLQHFCDPRPSRQPGLTNILSQDTALLQNCDGQLNCKFLLLAHQDALLKILLSFLFLSFTIKAFTLTSLFCCADGALLSVTEHNW